MAFQYKEHDDDTDQLKPPPDYQNIINMTTKVIYDEEQNSENGNLISETNYNEIYLKMKVLIKSIKSSIDLSKCNALLQQIALIGFPEKLAFPFSKILLRYIKQNYNEFDAEELNVIGHCLHQCICSANMASNIFSFLIANSEKYVIYPEIIEELLSNLCPYSLDVNVFAIASKTFQKCTLSMIYQHKLYYNICTSLINGLESFDLYNIVDYEIYKLFRSLPPKSDGDIIHFYYLLFGKNVTTNSVETIAKETNLIELCESIIEQGIPYIDNSITYLPYGTPPLDLVFKSCFIVHKLLESCNHYQKVYVTFIPFTNFFYEFYKQCDSENEALCIQSILLLYANTEFIIDNNTPDFPLIMEFFKKTKSCDYCLLVDALYSIFSINLEAVISSFSIDDLENLSILLSSIYTILQEAKPKILNFFLLLLNYQGNIIIQPLGDSNAYTPQEICKKIICDKQLQYDDESETDCVSRELIFHIVNFIGKENMFEEKLLKKHKTIVTWYTIYNDFKDL